MSNQDLAKLLKFKNLSKKTLVLNIGNKSINLINMKIKTFKDTDFRVIKHILRPNEELTNDEIIEEANKYKRDIEEICNMLKIDPVTYGYSPFHIAKYFVNHFFHDKEFNELDNFEIQQMKMPHTTDFKYINTEQKTSKSTTTYDINSYFPSLFTQSLLKCPIKSGTKGKLAEINIKKLFDPAYYLIEAVTLPISFTSTSKTLWLTNYGVKMFIESNCDFKLKQDCEYNYYHYDNFVELRGRSGDINKLYDIKKTNTQSKMIITLIHGIMFNGERATHTTRNKEYEIEYMDETGEIKVENVRKNENYNAECNIKYNWFRFKPFFYSFCRYAMFKHVNKLQNDGIKIFRVYCDSITCKKNDYLDSLLNEKLGGFKIENKNWNGKKGRFLNHTKWEEL